ncbi:MAG: hypothetical protein F6J93_21670 [Oscillatoria sp. SIO1A7]|nr:hypothetical protein [Oscillatoria sp. SIO1A7]
MLSPLRLISRVGRGQKTSNLKNTPLKGGVWEAAYEVWEGWEEWENSPLSPAQVPKHVLSLVEGSPSTQVPSASSVSPGTQAIALGLKRTLVLRLHPRLPLGRDRSRE